MFNRDIKNHKTIAVGLILVFLLFFPSVASTLVSYTTTVFMTILSSNFFVDNNVSNVDSVFDSGTHSDFLAQQNGPDSVFDTLTEEETASESGYQVQQGDFLFQGTDNFILLDNAVNMTYSFVLMPNIEWQENVTAATSGDPAMNSDDDMVTVYLYNSTHLRIQRYASDDGDLRIGWQVLECFNSEFIVQRGEKSISGFAGTSTSDTIPTSVSETNSMAWHYFRTSTTSRDGRRIQFYSNVTDSTTITFTRQSTSSITGYFRWLVVEWNPSKIDHFAQGYIIGYGTDSSPFKDDIGIAINESQSILVFQTHAIGDDGLDTSTTAGYILNNTHVAFYNYDSSFNRGIKWYVIDFGSGVGSRQDNDHIAWSSTDYVNDDVLDPIVQTNRTLVWLSGSCNGDGTAKPRHTQWWALNPTNSTHSDSLHYERRYGGQNREIAWQVLELPYSSEDWFSGWEKRVRIEVDNNDIINELSDFPFLIHLSNSSGRNGDDVSFVFDELQSDANRKKIAVTTSDSVTQCYVEVEQWSDVDEQAWLWVKAPNLNNISDTAFYLYYDSAQADNTDYVGDPNSTTAENVWNTDYLVVHHLEEDPTGSVTDSTGYDNDMSSAGSMGSSDLVDGKIGKGVDFDGINDHYESGSNQVTIEQFTFEAWIWIGANNDWWRTIATVGDDSVFRDFCIVDRVLALDDGSPNNFGSALSAGAWHNIVVTYDDSTIKGYIEGSEQTETYSKSYGSITDFFTISEWGGTYDYFDGILDEIRISNTSRSAEWIKASYESGRDDLLDFGSEESLPFELDLEVQWTNLDFDETNEELCIYGGTMGSENIRVDVWNGSNWQNLFTDLTTSWNNVTITSYLTTSTLTIRFKGNIETNDSVQDSWEIDATLIHAWS